MIRSIRQQKRPKIVFKQSDQYLVLAVVELLAKDRQGVSVQEQSAILVFVVEKLKLRELKKIITLKYAVVG